jgi:hypothetical protein
MMDFASMTYLPETRSKSKSYLEISFTNAFTLSMELSEILTVFMITSSRKFRLFFGRAGGKSVNNSSWQHISAKFILPFWMVKVKVKAYKDSKKTKE